MKQGGGNVLNNSYISKKILMIQFKISFAGAGKVGGALCIELHNKGHFIQQIVSKDKHEGNHVDDAFNDNSTERGTLGNPF